MRIAGLAIAGAIIVVFTQGSPGASPCGLPGSGDCAKPHATPGCEDQATCECVCADDPFCCAVEWDGLCVNEAPLCLICNDRSGSCFIPQTSPGCSSFACCYDVCAFDSFCCEVEWDDFCVDSAHLFCGSCDLFNLVCEFAYLYPILDGGSEEFYTCTRGGVGPPLPAECDEGYGLDFYYTQWFSHVATCDGLLNVSTCNDANMDTRLAVYAGPCSDLRLLACNDNSRGCALRTSRVIVPVTASERYFIRVGSPREAVGGGTVTVFHEPGCHPGADLNDDGVVNSLDLGILLSSWTIPPATSCASPCPADLNADGVVTSLDLGMLLSQWTL